MTGFRLSCLLAAGFLLSACTPQLPRVSPPPDERVSRPAPVEIREPAARSEAPPPPGDSGAEPGGGAIFPDLASLEQRQRLYEQKFLQWQAIDDQMASGIRGREELDADGRWSQCLQRLHALYHGYARLREQRTDAGVATDRFPAPAADPWTLLRTDLEYLESDCDAVHQRTVEQLAERERQRLEPARHLEAAIVENVQKFRYADALQAYRSLERRFPGWQPSLETRRSYGLALLHTGQIDKAGPVLLEVLPQLEPADQMATRRVVADLLWATHRFEEARAIYLSLSHHFASWRDSEHWVADQLAILEQVDHRSPEMAAYASLLREYLTFDGRHLPKGLEEEAAQISGKFPGSMIDQRARQILRRTREQAAGWMDRQVATVISLKDEKQFSQALVELEALLQENLTAETAQLVERIRDEVLAAEAAEREKEQLREVQDLASRWEEASHLFDLENYHDAYALYGTLLQTEYESRARSRMQEAANRASSEMRRQAANFFVRAREAGSAERKMDLLLESRRLLRTIIEKYPEADIISNVRRNLEVIDQHIRDLDPGRLPAS